VTAFSRAVMDVREIMVEGRTVRVRVAGDGPPLVLVHGLGGSWRWWSPVVKLLAAHRQVHLVDLPPLRRGTDGVGMATWLSHWFDAANLERADVAGHSLGGLLAAELAATHPHRVCRLVLVSPAGVPSGFPLRRRSAGLLATLYDMRVSLALIAPDVIHTRPLSLARGVAFAHRDVRPALPAVRSPTLLAWGEHDRLVPLRLADEWQRLLPVARLVRLPCGHVPMLEVPGQLATSMLTFLDE
jgi:pimeloyl-ACP methyl ester carboxylesterase